MSITTAQIRGARGILGWSQQDLAEHTGISATSIGSIENGQSTPREKTLLTIRKAFESSGIEFLGLEGVKQRKGDVRVLHGHDEVMAWYDDLYQVGVTDKRPYLLSNVNEDAFLKIIGPEFLEKHKKRVKELNLHYKILIKEGDTNFISSDWGEYRWAPKETFGYVQFFVYGDKLSLLLFEKEEPEIIIIHYPAVAEAYRLQFQLAWDSAKIIEEGKR